MAVYRIPLSPSPQKFSINLGGVEYGIVLRYRNFLEPFTVVDIAQLAPGTYSQYSNSDIVNFSRDSIATYEQDGSVIKVERNVPRLTKKGLLVEDEGHNSIPFSENFSNSLWRKIAGGGSVAPTVTENIGIAPDGTVTANFVQFGSISAPGDYSSLTCDFTGISVTGSPAAQAIWMKSTSGGSLNLFFRFSLTNPTGSSHIVEINNEWKRFDQYLLSPASTNIGIVIRADYTVNAGTSPSVFIWGAHRQNGTTLVGSYIPTNGSPTTRPKEIVTIGHNNNKNSQGGWVVDITDRTGLPMVNGITLVTGCDLLAQYRHLGFNGQLRVQTDDAPDAVPTFVNLGNQSHLYWITT